MIKKLALCAGVLCLTLWALTVFVYGATELVHVLLAFAAICLVFGFIKLDEPDDTLTNHDIF